MRIKTILVIVITILLTVVIMQNAEPVYVKALFFTFRTSKLMVMLVIAVLAFIAGYLAGRPSRTIVGSNIDHGYDDRDAPTAKASSNRDSNTLSDEDRDYISED